MPSMTKTWAGQIRWAGFVDEHLILGTLGCSLTRGVFWYKIYDLGPGKVFTVHSREVFTQDKSCYFSNSKVFRKNGTGKSVHYKEVFTSQGCSLYERFHCID